MTDSLTEALGRQVIAADSAEELGEVKTFTADRTGRRLTGIHVAGRKRNARMVSWDAITAFGSDAVMVTSSEEIFEVEDERTDDMIRGDVEYLGATVLTADGEIIGTVDEVHFEEDSGQVVGLLTDKSRIDGDRIRSLGSFAVVVDRLPE